MSKQDRQETPSLADGIRNHAGSVLGIGAALLVTIATIVYHFLEDWSWVDAVYFSVVAVTTVGFGDLAPTTDASKLFTVLYVLAGIGAITAYLDQRFRRISDRVEHRRRARHDGE